MIWKNLLTAICFVAFVGGCSYTLTKDTEYRYMDRCVSKGYNWQDGNCVKP